MSNSEIVHDKDGQRTISVNRNYNDGIITELYLICDGDADLVYVSSEDKPEKFGVSAEVMDRIADAWQQYRADEQVRKEAEEAKEKAEDEEYIVSAYRIANECPAISIQELPGPCWKVSIPEIGHRYEQAAYYPLSLLKQAQTAKEVWENHTREDPNNF